MRAQCTKCQSIVDTKHNFGNISCNCGQLTAIYDNSIEEYELISDLEDSIIYLDDWGIENIHDISFEDLESEDNET